MEGYIGNFTMFSSRTSWVILNTVHLHSIASRSLYVSPFSVLCVSEIEKEPNPNPQISRVFSSSLIHRIAIMSQNGKLMPNLDQQSTKLLNLTVLQRIDPFVEEILITAAHVTFYEFNIDLSQWVRNFSFF